MNNLITHHILPRWPGPPLPDTYGNKPLLEKAGKPVFAEIYALRLYEEQGYQGVWVDNYRSRCVRDMSLTNVIEDVEDSRLEILRTINGRLFRSGTWDLLLWKGEEVRFVELKRMGKDRIRAAQVDFYTRALEKGYAPEQFVVFEWEVV